jgi:hypothetical protein
MQAVGLVRQHWRRRNSWSSCRRALHFYGRIVVNRRIVLQTPIEVTSSQSQDLRFAIPTAGAKSALVWINVHKNTASSGITMDILGSSSMTLPDPSSGSFWKPLITSGISITAGTVGVFTGSVTTVPDFLRWKITIPSNACLFEIVVYLYDT